MFLAIIRNFSAFIPRIVCKQHSIQYGQHRCLNSQSPDGKLV